MTLRPARLRLWAFSLLVLCGAIFLSPAGPVAADEPKADRNPPKETLKFKIDPAKPGEPGAVMEGEAPAMVKEMEKEPSKDAKKDKEKEKEKVKEDRTVIDALLAGRPKKVVKAPTLTSAEVDTLVDTFLKASKAPPATPTLDVEFVRRIYLDVTGKLPTPEQTRAFVNANDRAKRGKLIEHLLNSPDYAQNWSSYWTDVIRYHATNQNPGQVRYDELQKWLKTEIAQNKPWDEVASVLIRAKGRVDENGAAAFSIAHDAQAVEVAGEVSRIFLGVQIQCAQCHDHPTDSWKRQQFHEFASFFAGEKVRRANKGMERPAIFEVFAQPKTRYTMPDLKDPTKNHPVAPKFFLASDASAGDAASKPLPGNLNADDRRELVASFITGPDNPWFARAYVNRIWQALLGEGFYMPVDDIGPERTAKAPEILDALADQFRDSGYDTRWLFKTILNSKAYQREIRSTYSASGRSIFASNTSSRLRADQIFDSLVQVLDLKPNAGGGGAGPAAKKKDALKTELKDAAGKMKGVAGRNFTPRAGFNLIFGVDPSMASDDVLGTIPQALFLMNSPILNRSIEAKNGTVLGDILTNHSDNRSALFALYVRTLAREPTPKEVQTCGKYLDGVGDRREAFEDILWSLINSTEFISRR